jgi:hypothetical protein
MTMMTVGKKKTQQNKVHPAENTIQLTIRSLVSFGIARFISESKVCLKVDKEVNKINTLVRLDTAFKNNESNQHNAHAHYENHSSVTYSHT